MRTIKTLLHVKKDHTVNIKIKLPKEVAPGNYSALVLMDETSHEIETGRLDVRKRLNVFHGIGMHGRNPVHSEGKISMVR